MCFSNKLYLILLFILIIHIFLQVLVGKIKVTAKQGLKILRIHGQNSTLITNGIRKEERFGNEWIFLILF